MAEDHSPELRASDVDRELTASQLRRHATAGRLTLPELDDRLGWTYQAKTIADLQKLTSDLPDLSKEALPASSTQSVDLEKSAARPRGDGWTSNRSMWGSYVSVNLLQILIWAIVSVSSTSWVYPWWVWIAGPWGVALLGQEIQRRTRPPRGDRSIES